METPNVVLITVDCLRYDRCGFNGHNRNTTPVLDELANESYVFDRAYSTGPYTTESVPGIIAGQHSYNGAHYSDDVAWKAIPAGSQTLATYLRDQGHRTIATLTNPHLIEARGFDRGFQQFRNLRTRNDRDATPEKGPDTLQFADLMYEFRSRMRRYGTLLNPYTLPYVLYRYSQYRTDWPTISGERVIGECIADVGNATEPFFAWTHLMDLHAPINPRAIQQGGLAASDRAVRHLLSDAARAGWIHEPMYETLYDSALRYVDSCIGRLVTALRKQGRWEDTVLVLTSDHGEVLFDRGGIYGHPRHHLFDELLHVPLLLREPSGSGKRIDRPFSLAWIHELLSDILATEPGDFPTRSGLRSVLHESGGKSNAVVSDSLDDSGHSIAVRDGETKHLSHVRVRRTDEPEYGYFDRDVTYQYSTDRGERIPMEPTARSDLRALARDLATSPDEHPTIEGEFEPELEQRLRDLGYRM